MCLVVVEYVDTTISTVLVAGFRAGFIGRAELEVKGEVSKGIQRYDPFLQKVPVQLYSSREPVHFNAPEKYLCLFWGFHSQGRTFPFNSVVCKEFFTAFRAGCRTAFDNHFFPALGFQGCVRSFGRTLQ